MDPSGGGAGQPKVDLATLPIRAYLDQVRGCHVNELRSQSRMRVLRVAPNIRSLVQYRQLEHKRCY